MKAAFDRFAVGLGDATAYAEGDTSCGRTATSSDLKAIRAETDKSQAEFADAVDSGEHAVGLTQPRHLGV